MDAVSEGIKEAPRDGLFTRRQWLMVKLIADGTPWFIAMEAVHSVALEHPEWDLDEERTWDDWEKG